MKKALIGIVVLLAIVLGVKGVMTLLGPSDQQLIKEALQEAIKASREGRAGSVMDFISQKLKVNEVKIMGRDAADFIRQAKPEIVVKSINPVVNDAEGTAIVQSTVNLKVSYLGFNIDRDVEGVTLKFARESAREWLIFPVKQWRLTDVSLPPDAIPANLGFGMGSN
jgi:hypothetical protein